ncbi:hypothetical protein M2447_001009 [Ereboglobus sp. PH5-10]|uniref:hypothetical protein n=1 Tax=Ereboglobus sp. PH5-10 TaxID=2940629 RepID=UPI002404ED57|nr:hypothetical protein [Ereboglobus sp. PH5-10]MDF9826924.1 hypothetical protein [Ereboglobus sp. PH5-10]
MKKAVRIILVSAGALLLLLAVVVMALFQPPVQTWLVRKVVSGQQGCEIEIGRVSAGLNKVELTGVQMKGRGMTVDLPLAVVEMPLLGLIREKVDVKKITAKGWTLDLSQPAAEPPPTAGAPAPDAGAPESGGKNIGGILDMLRFPVDLAVEDADIEGAIVLPPETPDAAPVRAGVSVRGGQLRPGNDGRFELALNMEGPESDAAVSAIQVTSSLLVRMGAARDIQSLIFDVDAKASGAQLPRGARLQINIAASKNASGEDYSISLKSQEEGSEKNILSIKATNPSGPEGLNAMWVVDLRDADLAPFTGGLGLKLPAFKASGQGTFAAADNFTSFHAAGKISGDASRLEVFDSALSELGHVKFSSDFDVVNEGDLLRVGVLSADVLSDVPVASIKTLQLIEINTANGEIKVPDLQGDLLRVDVHGLPLAWARPFIKDTGLAISGDPLRGGFTGRAQGNGYSIRSATPLTLGGLSVARDGVALVKNLDVAASFTADYSNAAWAVGVSDFSIRSNGAPLAVVTNARAGGAVAPDGGISTTGRARLNIPAILAQPVAAGLCALSGGAVDADFSGRVSKKISSFEAKLAASDLRAGDGEALPEVSANVRADIHADGTLEIQAPAVFELNGRKSDIELGATLKPDGACQNIDASIASNDLYVEDLMIFSALVPEDSGGAKADGDTGGDAKETGASRNGVSGQVKFALKNVVWSQDLQAANVGGEIKVTPSLFSLENLRGQLSDGAEIKADGSMKYDAAAGASAYSVDAKVALANFDPAPFLRMANPGKTPTVEGRFDINGVVTGTAASLVTIADGVNADLTLTSRGGKFHGFSPSVKSSGIDNLHKDSGATSTIAAISGAILSLVGKSDNSATLEKIKTGRRVLERLGEIDFDQINLDASYRAGREIEIRNFSLLSPDMRFAGMGTLGNKPALSLFKQALSMNLQMAVRGEQAEDLRALNILKKETDADTLGYMPLLENFSMEGTPSNLIAASLVRHIVSMLAKK